ncbi:hypothetical protein C8J57DRAFT_1230464 [Mycena rebaudengoi]|nr:hypothetical protein C8J57DRAFT_1230464 [Mycena rebaudengoi]
MHPLVTRKTSLARRKRRHENSDLHEKTGKRSRTSVWRDENGITKKARDTKVRAPITSFFKPRTRFDADSDIEMISRPSSPAPSPSVHVPVETPPAPLVFSSAPIVPPPSPAASVPAPTPVESPSSAEPHSQLDDNSGYSTNDSNDDERIHQLSLTAAAETFKDFDKKLKTYRKLHLAPKVLTAMTPEKGAQRMVLFNGLTEFNIQRNKREVERIKLAKTIDEAPRPQRPKLRARFRKMKPSISASITVANQFSKTKYWAQKLRSAARTFSETGQLPENNQGKGAKHKTHFDDPDVKPRLEAFARGLVPQDKGGFKGRIAPDKLRRYVNEYLLPELEIDDTISVVTAMAWLKKLGYRLRRYQKGIYYDGHERPDVVQKRNEFITDMFACLRNAYQYEDNNEEETGTSQSQNGTSNMKEIPPKLKPGDVIDYPIFHDESTVHANDQSHFVWETDDQHELRQKSRGRLIHLSDFIIEHCGRLVLTAEEIKQEELLPKRPLSPAELESERVRLEATAAAAAAAAEKERIAAEQGKKPRDWSGHHPLLPLRLNDTGASITTRAR